MEDSGILIPSVLPFTALETERLTKVFFGESTDQDVAVFDDVDGTCTDQGVASMAPVSLAANTLSPVALTCGFNV